MPKSFSRSLGRLDLEGRGLRFIVIAGAAVLLAAWTMWFLRSRVAVYAVSEGARLEVDRAPYPVETPVGGRVVSTTLTMGRMVRLGEVLVELDVRAQSFGVSEERARLSGLGPQIARVEAEIAEQQRGRRDEQAASVAAIAEMQASQDEARAAAELAADSEARMAKLAAQGWSRTPTWCGRGRDETEARGGRRASSCFQTHRSGATAQGHRAPDRDRTAGA